MGFTPIPKLSDRAYWRLENENDSSGNSRTLTNINTVTFGAGKFSNGALFTNGTPFNKGLTRDPNPFSALRPTNITFSFWFKLTDTTNHSSTFSVLFSLNTDLSGTTGMAINATYTISGGNITLSMVQGFSGGSVTINSPAIAIDGNWHYYVYIKEGLDFRFYRDCVLMNSGTGTGNEVSSATGTHIHCIGNDRASSKTREARGIMDEFIMEERVWTLREIRMIYGQYKGYLGV